MVYVGERYLPGLSRSDLLRGLSKLEATKARTVRYLGSTIVLGDEACFCQFEGPSEAAVAEANRKAGLSFDRIVPAVTVTPSERRPLMTASHSIPTTLEMRPSRLVAIVVLVAAVTAAITWALVTFAGGSGTEATQGSVRPSTSQQNAAIPFALGLSPQGSQYVQGITSLSRLEQAAAFGGHGGVLDALKLRARDKQYVHGITSLSPAERAAAFGGNR